MPTVQPFMGICTLKNVPIKLTANRAQTPCKAVRRRAVKNLFDLTDVIKITIRYKEKTLALIHSISKSGVSFGGH